MGGTAALGVALVNPVAGVATWAVAAYLIDISGAQRELLEGATALFASVVLLWDLLLVTLIALPSVQRRLSAVVWRVERTAGGVLMAFGCWIVWQFLHEFAVRLYA